MNILENELEEVVFQALQNNRAELRQRGLWAADKYEYYRQVELGEYGRADIIGLAAERDLYRGNIIVAQIFELKKDRIGVDTLLQAVRYGKGLSQRIEAAGIKSEIEIKIVLLGKSVDVDSDFIYLTDLFPNVNYYTYSIDLIAGMMFTQHHEYSLKAEGFRSNDKEMLRMVRTGAKRTFAERIKLNLPDNLPF